ncbi:PD-(D/E)XK motif protein [Micromonospora globispora]|uniref:PD-(D/E)XK motif protein n=1 Tax=Micromonospora globispora TaxID=1450148 RepID=A0A317JRK5_9ACTN|nr:PD-(D/E)XK motif protein [Micromonospora globispora]PWU43461.1 PD-(D/E)XK motif protein [Micromonospora globispora]
MINASRHLSLAGFEQYLRKGVAIEQPIDGEPRLVLTIDPDAPALALRAPRRPHETPLKTGLEHVRVISGHASSGPFLQIRVTDPRLFLDAYPVLCSIADRVQLQGLTFSAAVSDTLRSLGKLLTRDEALPRDREIGLVGELLTLLGLSEVVGPALAVAAWRGPHAEEHDFGLSGCDVEVKTASSEERIHWIRSLTQLQPSADRALWLVSHQLTEASPGDGWRVGDLVTAARKAASEANVRDELDRRLAAAGWADPFTELCRTRWRRRFPSAAYLVAGDFPALTPARLGHSGANLSAIKDVRYRIDLTGRMAGPSVPALLSDAIAFEVSQL